MLVDKLKKLLDEALVSSGEVRMEAIKEFQNKVWNDISIQDDTLNDILTDAAYIFDFYEPNKEWRKEDPSYYGDVRLEEEIVIALQKLKEQSFD